jgi:hypothetical protein
MKYPLWYMNRWNAAGMKLAGMNYYQSKEHR